MTNTSIKCPECKDTGMVHFKWHEKIEDAPCPACHISDDKRAKVWGQRQQARWRVVKKRAARLRDVKRRTDVSRSLDATPDQFCQF